MISTCAYNLPSTNEKFHKALNVSSNTATPEDGYGPYPKHAGALKVTTVHFL
jgi:hypothetical protein